MKNHDTSNFITVGLKSASDTSYHKVDAGETLVVPNISQDTNTDGSTFSAFVSMTSISLKADTGSVVCSFIAF